MAKMTPNSTRTMVPVQPDDGAGLRPSPATLRPLGCLAWLADKVPPGRLSPARPGNGVNG